MTPEHPPGAPPPAPARAPSSDAGRSLAMVVYGALFVFMWIGWIIFLAGTAAGQDACVKNLNSLTGRRLLEQDTTFMPKVLSRAMLSEPHIGRDLLAVSNSYRCSTDYSLPWWIVWFQFLIMLLIAGLAVSSSFYASFRNGVLIFLTIETTMLMMYAGVVNGTIVANDDGTSGNQNKTRQAAGAAMAGIIILLLSNLSYLFLASSKAAGLEPVLSLPTGVPKAPPPMPPMQEVAYAAPPPPTADKHSLALPGPEHAPAYAPAYAPPPAEGYAPTPDPK